MTLKQRNRKDFLIEVISPASRIIEEHFDKNIAILKKELANVTVSSRVYSKGYLGYLAGTREERAEVFINSLKRLIDNDGGGIVFARGGYGSVHLLPYIKEFIESLDQNSLAILGKVFLFGYSDVTALMWYLSQYGIKSFYAPNVSSVEFKDITLPLLKNIVLDNKIYLDDLTFNIEDLKTKKQTIMRAKSVDDFFETNFSGVLLGGTLSVVASLAGTEFFEIEQEKIILFLEDIAEAPYKIDRYLTQLEFSGLLEKTEAIILGSFKDCGEYQKVFNDFKDQINIPVFQLENNIGHGGFDRWILLGREFEIKKLPQ